MESRQTKNRVRRAFDRAAGRYDEAAVVQQVMADELLDRLDVLKFSPKRILDAGCGTGYAFKPLRRRYPEAELILVDFSFGMLSEVDASAADCLLCADVERLPLAAHSVDMVFCNGLIEWCDYSSIFTEFLRVLKPEGLLTFATLGPDSLAELRALWRQVDGRVKHHRFPDMHNLGDALVERQFSIPVMDVDFLKITHKEIDKALQDLKNQGAAVCAPDKGPGLRGARVLQQIKSQAENFRNDSGVLETTCELVYGHAWSPLQFNPYAQDGVAAIPLEQLRRHSKTTS